MLSSRYHRRSILILFTLRNLTRYAHGAGRADVAGCSSVSCGFEGNACKGWDRHDVLVWSRSTSEFPSWLVLHLRLDVSTFSIFHSLEMPLTFFLCCLHFPPSSESDTSSTWIHQFVRRRAPELIEASRKMLSELLVYCCERRCLCSCRCTCCRWRFSERGKGWRVWWGVNSYVLMWNCS